MAMESEKDFSNTLEARTKKDYEDALRIVEESVPQWERAREALKKYPGLLADNTEVADVISESTDSKPGLTGIFEKWSNDIDEKAKDTSTRSKMMEGLRMQMEFYQTRLVHILEDLDALEFLNKK